MIPVYVHFPFCARICSYCDFAVLQGSERLQKNFAQHLLEEARLRWGRVNQTTSSARTLYWGGGTPSELSGHLLGDIGREFRKIGLLGESCEEFTVELNPESTTEDRLQVLGDLGVHRFSLGAQSFHAKLLNQLGRQASALQTLDAMHRLLATKMRLSLDFMFCLPGQSLDMFLKDLETACSAGVSHISFYGLEVHSNTLLGQQVRKGITHVSDQHYAEFYRQGVQYLESQGLFRYEVSNFSRPGQESIHNRSYWERGDYLGLGPGAHSFLGGIRMAAPRKLLDWQKWVSVGCPDEGMELDPIGVPEALLETVWLGLRQSKGLDMGEIQQRFGDKINRKALDRFSQKGWIENLAGKIALIGEGWIFMDQVVAGLLEE